MEMDDFEKTLETFAKTFTSMNDKERNLILLKTLQLCGPVQLTFLTNELEFMVKRDFIKWLPTEVTFHVLKWLSCETLGRCCSVSKTWNKIISSCDKVWANGCKVIGIDNVGITDIKNWKMQYVCGMDRFKRLKCENIFKRRILQAGHVRETILGYIPGYFATGGSDRQLRLWSAVDNTLLYSLTCHSCASLKFNTTTVLTASYDTTLALWEWTTARNLCKYKGHVGAVFCCDYDEDIDLVVSGSSDSTVKLWQMSTGQCLATRLGHKEWVFRVKIKKVPRDPQNCLKEEYILISMTKTEIKIWSVDPRMKSCLITFPAPNHSSQTCLQPNLFFIGQHIMCASDDGVLIWNIVTTQLKRMFTAFASRKLILVAVGQIHSILFAKGSLYIMNNADERCIRVLHLPSNNQLPIICGAAWLDNWDVHGEHGAVFAVPAPENDINIIEWADDQQCG